MIFHKRLGFTPTFYETPGVTSGGQGAPPANVQPPASGQGEGGVQPTAQQGDFNWGLFPDVPEDQRVLLQPHLRTVMGHATRMEQQLAPYKPLVQAGYTEAEEISGLLGFAQAFDSDPLSAWYELGATLQQRGLLTEDIDFDEVRALMDGTYDDGGGDLGASGLPEGIDPNNPLAQMVMQQQQLIEELRSGREEDIQARQQEQVAQQQARTQRLLETQVANITRQLVDSGIPEDSLDKRMILGQIAVHNGNENAVIQSLTSFRNAGVRQVIDNHTQRPGRLNLPRGNPPAPGRTVPRGGRTSWDDANDAAMQFLKQQSAAAGQEA